MPGPDSTSGTSERIGEHKSVLAQELSLEIFIIDVTLKQDFNWIISYKCHLDDIYLSLHHLYTSSPPVYVLIVVWFIVATMVFKSPFPDIDIPKCNILDFMFPADKVPSDKPLWIDADDPSHSLSPCSALQWIKRLGFGMERLGIKRGDACLIFTPNHIYVPVAYLGFVGYGASFSGSNPAFTVKGKRLL